MGIEVGIMSRLSRAPIICIVTGLLGLMAAITPVGVRLEETLGLDLLFQLRGPRKPPADVVIVTIDRASANKLGVTPDPEEWSRYYHARLTERLVEKGAAVIAFDIMFDKERSQEEDSLFAKAISSAHNVVLCECLTRQKRSLTDNSGQKTASYFEETVVPPISRLAESALAVAPFPLPKLPVKLSQYWTFKTSAGQRPTLPVVVFQIFSQEMLDEFDQLLGKTEPSQTAGLPNHLSEVIREKPVEKRIQDVRDLFRTKPWIARRMLEQLNISGQRQLEPREQEIIKALIRMYQSPDSLYLNFYGPSRTVTTLPYYQVIEHDENSRVEPIDLRGKAVFVGVSESLRQEEKDDFYTAFNYLSGVEIAATAFANLIEDMPIRPLNWLTHLVLIMFWGLLLGFLCYFLPTILAAGSLIVLGILYLILSRLQFGNTGIWLPLVIPLILQTPVAFFGVVIWRLREKTREHKKISDAIGYYLPKEVVIGLTKEGIDIRSNRRVVYGTCLYTDVAGYTRLSESMDPERLANLINRYFERVFEPVRKYEGIVSDVIGDSMLAIWAKAEPDKALRNNVCLAALAIQSAVNRFNETPGIPKLPTRIGVNSGSMMLCNVGAGDHYEYRAVGDVLNSVSRIEGLNKYLGTTILVSEDVIFQLDVFFTRKLGQFLLVGKRKPIVIYELVCHMEESNQQQRRKCATFEQALSAFKRQSWEEAIEQFQKAQEITGEDGPSRFYIDECQKYRQFPPGEDWNGVVQLEHK
jgi:adenylate cyclase